MTHLPFDKLLAVLHHFYIIKRGCEGSPRRNWRIHWLKMKTIGANALCFQLNANFPSWMSRSRSGILVRLSFRPTNFSAVTIRSAADFSELVCPRFGVRSSPRIQCVVGDVSSGRQYTFPACFEMLSGLLR